jgi:hypothetical protein
MLAQTVAQQQLALAMAPYCGNMGGNMGYGNNGNGPIYSPGGTAANRSQGRTRLTDPEGSWVCPSCANVNWPKRTSCNKCKIEKPNETLCDTASSVKTLCDADATGTHTGTSPGTSPVKVAQGMPDNMLSNGVDFSPDRRVAMAEDHSLYSDLLPPSPSADQNDSQ